MQLFPVKSLVQQNPDKSHLLVALLVAFFVFQFLLNIFPAEVFINLRISWQRFSRYFRKIPPKACCWGKCMTSHSSPEKENTKFMSVFPSRLLLQASARVPMYSASQRMLIYHQWICSLTFDSEKFRLWVEPSGRVRAETHSQQVSRIKQFLL